METKARVLEASDCGSLLLDHSRTPYIVGCVLPLSALRTGERIATRLESRIQLQHGIVSLELHVTIDMGNHLHFTLSYATHRDFLLALSESYTLYLLTGPDHPAARKEPGRTTLYQRVYEGGVAIEIPESVRSQINLLERYCNTIPMSFRESAAALG